MFYSVFPGAPIMNANAEVLPRRHRISADEYHRMGEAGIFSEDDRVELIEGEIIDMTPIGTRHADAVRKLIQILASNLPKEALLDVQNPVRLNDDNEPQPDMAVIKNRRYIDIHPGPEDILLLIEIADTSLDYDRNIKVPLYARHGIPEVWLVDLAGEIVEVFRKPSPTGYLEVGRHGLGERFKALLLPEVEVDPEELLGA